MQKRKKSKINEKNSLILGLWGRRILDSRSDFTIETSIRTGLGTFTASVPHGASKGSSEAYEVPSLTAIQNINRLLAPRLIRRPLLDSKSFDQKLDAWDGSRQKFRLGGNTLLSVSIAACKANAAKKSLELYDYLAQLSGNKKLVLPIPFLNVLNGGKHADLENDIQETMLVPHKFGSFSSALGAGTAVFHSLRLLLHKKYGASATLVGDEGGFVPKQAKKPEVRLELLEKAVEQAGFSGKMSFALDAAATSFYYPDKKCYKIGTKKMTAGELVDYYKSLVKSFPIVSIEDGLAEEDWSGWQQLNRKMGKKIEIVGDDLLTTNTERIQKAIQLKACNALLLKPNQIGTVSESIEASALAKKAGWKVMVSHRSGETNESFIADLAVALGCGQCKFGAPDRGERIAKYNRLLEIEEELGRKAKFAALR